MRVSRRLIRVVVPIGLGLLALGAVVFPRAAVQGDDAPKKNAGFYVRPVPIRDEAAREALRAMGTSTIGFEYRIPTDKAVVFTFVARDDQGKIIKDLSTDQTFNPRGKGDENRGSVWITHVNPAQFTEDSKGKVKWAFRIDQVQGMGVSWETWQPDRYGTAKNRSSWGTGQAVETPEAGKEYTLWEIRAYPDDLHGINTDSPTTFHFQLRFTMKDVANGAPRGSVSRGDVEDRPPGR